MMAASSEVMRGGWFVEGEAPAEPGFAAGGQLGGSLALHPGSPPSRTAAVETSMPARSGVRVLALVSLASLGWALSFGVGATLSALWLNDHGRSAGCIGLNTTFYYLGVAVASPLVPALMRRGGRWC